MLTTDKPTFYDHSLNCANVAEACAIAAARRTAIAEGRAYRVEANWNNGGRFYWNGDRYTVLGLAKSLVFNRAENVIVTRPDGGELLADDIRAARY